MKPLPFHRAVTGPLRSDAGVINASSALIGILTMTVVGGVSATSIEGIIDAAHDAAAAQNASEVGTAEGLSRIMDGTFTGTAGLEAGGYLPAHRAAGGPRRFTALAPANGSCFVVVSRSATGAFYFVTDKIPHPEGLTADTVTGCIVDSAVQNAARDLEAQAATYDTSAPAAPDTNEPGTELPAAPETPLP